VLIQAKTALMLRKAFNFFLCATVPTAAAVLRVQKLCAVYELYA